MADGEIEARATGLMSHRSARKQAEYSKVLGVDPAGGGSFITAILNCYITIIGASHASHGRLVSRGLYGYRLEYGYIDMSLLYVYIGLNCAI